MTKRNTLKLVHSRDTAETPMEGYITPEALKDFLEPCQTREITFRSEKSLKAYRAMIYSINKQGEVRYRTIRSEGAMWGIMIWRMK